MVTKTLIATAIYFLSNLTLANGLLFTCQDKDLIALEKKLDEFFVELKINENWIEKSRNSQLLRYRLKNDIDDTSTLYLRFNPLYQIKDEIITLPSKSGFKNVTTVSKKEIVLALMQNGRETIFSEKACALEALQDHIGTRQMIVAWSENLSWKFPDGGPAKWNEAYWQDGTLKQGKPLLEAMNDFFINEDECSVGCYTATKIVIIQGILDYYQRIKKDFEVVSLIKSILRNDGEVLKNIESELMWLNPNTKDQNKKINLGKLLKAQTSVAAYNFVPGDWVYFSNPDKQSSDIPGYEGSNSIYMGRGMFDDLYNDNGHHYLYTEKIKEIYNWRYGVFSRSRDYAKIQPINSNQIHTLSQPPHLGGFVIENRSIPRFFGFE